MHWLTRQEKLVLMFLCGVMLCGSVLQYASKSWAVVGRMMSDRDDKFSFRSIDVNSAGLQELTTVPGIGPATAGRIIEYRTAHGPYQKLDDLDDVPGISMKRVKTLSRFLAVKGKY